MALNVTFCAGKVLDKDTPVVFLSQTEDLAISASAVQSTAAPTWCRVVRLAATEKTRVLISADPSPTASAGVTMFAGSVGYFAIEPGQLVGAIAHD